MIVAVVLAAGKSERMGQPKALLCYRGKTFLGRILEAIGQSRIRHALVVMGHHRKAIESALELPETVFNPYYEQGMSTSVQAGVRALPPSASGMALFLVDHPLVDSRIIDSLLPHLSAGRIVVPVHAGRRGHPVLFAADLFGEILALLPEQGLNLVVRRDPGRVVEVAVESAGILRDIDTPEQFGELLEEEGQ